MPAPAECRPCKNFSGGLGVGKWVATNPGPTLLSHNVAIGTKSGPALVAQGGLDVFPWTEAVNICRRGYNLQLSAHRRNLQELNGV